MRKFKNGDQVMGFVTIRTKRRELRAGIVEDFIDGRYKLSGNILATERELVPLDRVHMKRVLAIWNRYHNTMHLAMRLYEGAMASMYQPVKWVQCVQDTPTMPFKAGVKYLIAWWAMEGLYAIPEEGVELLIAHVSPGDDLQSDAFFKRHFVLTEQDCGE